MKTIKKRESIKKIIKRLLEMKKQYDTKYIMYLMECELSRWAQEEINNLLEEIEN